MPPLAISVAESAVEKPKNVEPPPAPLTVPPLLIKVLLPAVPDDETPCKPPLRAAHRAAVVGKGGIARSSDLKLVVPPTSRR